MFKQNLVRCVVSMHLPLSSKLLDLFLSGCVRERIGIPMPPPPKKRAFCLVTYFSKNFFCKTSYTSLHILRYHLMFALGGKRGERREEQTHSVSKRPGRIAFTRTFGPWDIASHFIRCRPFGLFVFAHRSAIITRLTPVVSVYAWKGGGGVWGGMGQTCSFGHRISHRTTLRGGCGDRRRY